MWDAGYAGVPALIRKVEQMFLGQYRHTLDNKGRLTIPARFRELLEDGAYITQGFDRNLRLLTEETFQATFEKVNKLSMTNPAARELRRLIFSNASRVEADRVGRVLIPQFLREIAGLESEAVFVGTGDGVEIWSPEAWEEQTSLLQDADANAQRFAELDLSI